MPDAPGAPPHRTDLPSQLPRLLWGAVGASLLFAFFAFGTQVALAPEETQVQYLPDDAFYYLVLADNRDALGSWTFDDGTTLTSGFHPLFALLHSWLAGARRSLAGSALRDAVLVSSFLSGLALAAALLWAARREHGFG